MYTNKWVTDMTDIQWANYKITFGKHKGLTLMEVPSTYLTWGVNNLGSDWSSIFRMELERRKRNDLQHCYEYGYRYPEKECPFTLDSQVESWNEGKLGKLIFLLASSSEISDEFLSWGLECPDDFVRLKCREQIKT